MVLNSSFFKIAFAIMLGVVELGQFSSFSPLSRNNQWNACIKEKRRGERGRLKDGGGGKEEKEGVC